MVRCLLKVFIREMSEEELHLQFSYQERAPGSCGEPQPSPSVLHHRARTVCHCRKNREAKATNNREKKLISSDSLVKQLVVGETKALYRTNASLNMKTSLGKHPDS